MKKKISLLIAMSVTLAMNVVAQSNNDAILSESRTSKPFHNINIIGEMNVKIVQDETPSVSVDGNKYQLDNTITMLRSDTLFVYQTNIRQRDRRTSVTINANGITRLEVSGKTKVDCLKMTNTDYLTVSAKDGAQIKLDVRSRKAQSAASIFRFQVPSLD
jgi:hypothetical protein